MPKKKGRYRRAGDLLIDVRIFEGGSYSPLLKIKRKPIKNGLEELNTFSKQKLNIDVGGIMFRRDLKRFERKVEKAFKKV